MATTITVNQVGILEPYVCLLSKIETYFFQDLDTVDANREHAFGKCVSCVMKQVLDRLTDVPYKTYIVKPLPKTLAIGFDDWKDEVKATGISSAKEQHVLLDDDNRHGDEVCGSLVNDFKLLMDYCDSTGCNHCGDI